MPIKKYLVFLALACTFALYFSSSSFACSSIECEIEQKTILTITPPPNPMAETTIPVALSGNLEGSLLGTLSVYAALDASTCDTATYAYVSDPGSGNIAVQPIGPFSVTANLVIEQPGTYLLCVFNSFTLFGSAEMIVGRSKAELEAEATKAVEANARERAEQAPVSLLSVRTVAHRGASASSPGHTRLVVTTNVYAHVTISLNHQGGTFRYRAPGSGGVNIPWSCRHPSLTYHYDVSAAGDSGAAISRSGRFRVPLTASMCRADARRSEERRRQEAREEEERKRKEESPKAKIEEHEREYCEKVLGGRPDGISTVAGHIYLNCTVERYRMPTEHIVVSESTLGD